MFFSDFDINPILLQVDSWRLQFWLFQFADISMFRNYGLDLIATKNLNLCTFSIRQLQKYHIVYDAVGTWERTLAPRKLGLGSYLVWRIFGYASISWRCRNKRRRIFWKSIYFEYFTIIPKMQITLSACLLLCWLTSDRVDLEGKNSYK